MTAWIAPTWQAIRWRPLVATWMAMLVGAFIVRFEAGVTSVFVQAVLTVCAGIAGVALADDAHEMLAPVPVSLRRRLFHRLGLVAPVAVAGGATVIVIGQGSIDGTTVATLVALVFSATAAFSVCLREWPERAPAAGALLPAVWLALVGPLGHRWRLGNIAQLWIEQPVLVMCWSLAIIAVVLDF